MLLQRREPYFDAAHSQVSSYFILQEEDDADGPPPMSHEVTITTQQEYEEESQTSPMKQDSFNEEDDSTSNNRSIANENVIRNDNNNKQANLISLNNEDPEDSGDEPCDLTSLSWLQNITNIMSVPALPTPPDSPDPNQNNARAADGTQPQPERTTRSMKLHQSITRCHEEFRRNQQLYATRDSVKPPFSYATMICMAMRENGNKMTLSEIYAWIKESFVYYRKADPSWQNSIRHNLSLNKVFVKVARSKDERGKGGFWQMDPDRLQERRRFKKRSVSDKEHVEQPLQKTRKRSKIGNQVQNTANKVNSPPVIENLLVFNDIYPRVEIQNMAMPLLPQLTTVDASEVDVEDSLPLLPLDSLLACTTDENHQNTVEVQSVQHGMQVGLAEDELTNLLLSGGWDDSQLELLDSLLDSL